MAKRKEQEQHVVPVAPAIDALTQQEIDLTTEVSSAIGAFAKGAVAFFTRAKAIEVKAESVLATMKALTAPTTADHDEQLQTSIKTINAGKKEAEEHWHPVTSTVFAFHRRLTGRRDRATKAFEEAATIGNKLHNKYVEEAKRKAEAETQRLRQEAEAKARAERNAELARLEAEAIAQEDATTVLSEREQKFVERILAGDQPIRAAQVAGYSDSVGQSKRLLKAEKILTAIEAKRQAAALREQAAAINSLPVEIEVEEVKPDVRRAVGAHDRTNWSAELLDEAAFRDAAFEGRHGIPRDCFVVDMAKLNYYARTMEVLLDRWPGVRAKKSTKVV